MGENHGDRARLEPAVRSAMSLRGAARAIVDERRPPRKKENAPLKDGCAYTLERYTADLNEEIEDEYLIDDEVGRVLLEKLAEAYGQRYSREDLACAIELANELNYCALMTQSSYGDGDEGISELEKQVPGFSRGLYAELLGYMAYVNR